MRRQLPQQSNQVLLEQALIIGMRRVTMKAIILDGSQANDITGERARKALMKELQTSGLNVEHIVLRERNIGACAGDFYCWVRSPGMCHVDDDNRRIAEAVINSDLLVYLTPVTFGGYSSTLKRMVDHLIQNLSPYFAMVNGETHHQRRYKKNPDFLAIGWMEAPDAQSEALFRYLVQRNGINLCSEKAAGGVVLAGQSDDEILVSVQNWLKDLYNVQPSQRAVLQVSGEASCSASPPQCALLIVGSPKTHKSTSYSLGEYLFEQLGGQSIQTETVHLYTIVRSPEKMKALIDAIDTADLVTLAFPVYWDSLPAPVIDTLEQIAAHRQSRQQTHRPLFTAISNCAFPEVNHNATGLAICEKFARQAEFQWAGGLAKGGGHGLGEKPLPEWGGRTIRMRKALELTAAALAQGQAIPKAAQDLMSKPITPDWLYRLAGVYLWKKAAKSYGAGKLLKRRPYSVEAK
jgi:multimeric flavodoxin WrbA